jgi:xanthine dehydrogenase YagS FAD-binding subunit
VNPFTIVRPDSHAGAAAVLASGDYRLPMLKAGGMDVVDHLKEGLASPDALVDIKRVRRRPGARAVEREGDRIVIDASATLAEIGADPTLRGTAPAVADAAGSAATPQVRTVASAAGNLLQRPRCWYYRNDQFDCLKKGGDRCFAIEGENAYHAVLGGAGCHIVHPSNLAVALSVLGGRVHLVGGERESLAIADLYQLPSQGVRREHVLEPEEVVTHVSLSAAPRSAFLAIKHKQSFDWPLVCAAASLELDGGRIRTARLCAGAVAPVPWRLDAVERALVGVDPRDDAGLRAACAAAAEGARPLRDNAYKITLLPVVVRRAVRLAAGLPAVEED